MRVLPLFLLFMAALSPLGAADPYLKTVLYGAAYYPEYMPYERLDKDVELMREAGITAVRMGESTWTSWEPRDGEFQFAWMERAVDKLHAAGIKVILGTPTYSVPPWLYRKHPEILVSHFTAAPPMTDLYSGTYPGSAPPGAYGPRQNIDLTNPAYRTYAERIIRQVVSHFKDHPAVIGFQVDNETGPNGLPLPNVQRQFVERLKEKYGTPQMLNKLWGFVYWGQLVDTWDDFPSREGILNPGYKLEWERFQHEIVTDFLGWQAKIVREYKRTDQFITHDFVGGVRTNVDQWAVARDLDIVAVNPYHIMQERLSAEPLWLSGDISRSLKHRAYLVTETNAQAIGWDSRAQYPPYDGQLRLSAYAHIAAGAGMIAYWHWHSLHYGQETYWKGVLSHDLEPNRIYAEVKRIGNELKSVGPQLVNLRKNPKVAILFSNDSYHTLQYMPVSDRVNYMTVLNQMYSALYDLNIEADFIEPGQEDLSAYRVLLVPPLYSASDVVLKRLAKYAETGGHIVMAFKSGFANENSTVRWEMAPGPLREAAGLRYQEFTSLPRTVRLTPDPYQLGEENSASVWAEFLIPENATVIARYDHPEWKFPAITRNTFGKGTLTYEGTYLSDQLQTAVIGDVLKKAGLMGHDQELPSAIKARHGVNAQGKTVHFYLNFSGQGQKFVYPYRSGKDLLAGSPVTERGEVLLSPWGVSVISEE